ncbi:MAG: MATE family efflux transporter [Clostridiales bacterium]|nr:MATE family efflux transporter [Clostridiales bacterium]
MENQKYDAHYIKMTEQSVYKLVLKFSGPTVLSMLVTNIYNMVDTEFVGKLGNSASGAVGVVYGFMALIQAGGFLFGQGSGSILSRKLGKGDKESASRTASTGFLLSLSLGIIMSVLCFIFLEPLVFFLGSTETIAPYAYDYIFFILLTAPLVVATFTLNNILRYEGRAFYGMIGLLLGSFLNIGGDALFMFVFDMGIKGAGLSTAISQAVSFVVLLIPFIRKKTSCTLSVKYIDLSFRHVWEISATGFPSLMRQGLNSFATILLNNLSGMYGDEAVAAMSIVSRVYFFVFAIALGIGQGFQPVSGYNYGAGKYSRVKKAYRFTVILATSVIIVLAAVTCFLAPDIIYYFREDQTVVGYGVRTLRLQCIFGVFMPFCMATEMLFQSTGKKLWATLISALRSGILFIPSLWLLWFFRGMSGIQEAQPLAFLLSVAPTTFFMLMYFRKLPKEDG